MKKLILTLANLVIITSLFAQAPDAFKYQTVVRDGSNAIIANQSVGLQISILLGSSSGTAVYVERHLATTNALGIVNLNIGQGSVQSGSFTGINWGSNSYFVKIELDPAGGSAYQLMGTSQLLSVPYALYAANTGGGSGSNWTISGSNIYNNNSGNVGIGITSPLTKLNVDGAIRLTGTNHFFEIYEDGTSATGLRFYRGGIFKGAVFNRDNFINVSNSNITMGLVVNLDDNKVGIGTNSPTGLLTVQGGGAGTSFPTIRATNSDGSGIAFMATANSSDAAIVVSQAGSPGIMAKFFDGGASDIVRISRDGAVARGRITLFGNNSTADVGGWMYGSAAYGLVMGEIVAGSYNIIANIYNVSGAQTFVPWVNNSISLGNSSYKWSAVWATNGTIQTSDKTKKENIRDLSFGLDAVMQLKPVSYTWKDKNLQLGTGTNYGFIAQDLEQILPDVVIHTYTSQEEIEKARTEKGIELDPENYGVKYSELVPVLVKAIQEQQAIIESMQKQIDELKSLIK